jgi:hypothetical protein
MTRAVRWGATVLAVLTLVVVALAPTPAQAKVRSSSVSLAATPRAVATFDPVTLRVAVPRGRFASRDLVRVERRTGDRWTSVRTARLPASGVVTITERPAAGRHVYRAVKPRTSRFAAATSRTVTVTAERSPSELELLAQPEHVLPGRPTMLTASSSAGSRAVGADVSWESRGPDGQWSSVGRSRLDGSGRAKVQVLPRSPGTVYRAQQSQTGSVEAAVSREVTVRVVSRSFVEAWVTRSHVAVGGTIAVEGDAPTRRANDPVTLQVMRSGTWTPVETVLVHSEGFAISYRPTAGTQRLRVVAEATDTLAQAVSDELVVTASDRPSAAMSSGLRRITLDGPPTGMAYGPGRPAQAAFDAPADTPLRLVTWEGAVPTESGGGSMVVTDPSGVVVGTAGPSGLDFRTRVAGRYVVTLSHRWSDQTLQVSVTSPATFAATIDGPTTRVSTEQVRGRRLDLTFTAARPGPVTLASENMAGWPPALRMVEVDSGRTVPELGDSRTWRLPMAGRYRLEMTPPGTTAETTADLRLVSVSEKSIALNGPTTTVTVDRRGGSAVYAVEVPAGEAVTVAATNVVRTPARGRAVVRVVDAEGNDVAGFDTAEDRLARSSRHHPEARWFVVVQFDGRATGSLSLDVSTPRDYVIGPGDRARIATDGVAGREVRVRFSVSPDEYIGVARTSPTSASSSTFVARADTLGDPAGIVLSEGSRDPYLATRPEELVLVRSPRLPIVLDEEAVVQRVRARPAEVDGRERLTFPEGRTFAVRRYSSPPGTRIIAAVVESDLDPLRVDLRVRGARLDSERDDRAWIETGDQPVDVIVLASGPGALDLQVTTPQRTVVSPGAGPVRLSTGDLVGRELAAEFEARAGDVVVGRTSERDGWTACTGALRFDRPDGFRSPQSDSDLGVVSEGRPADRDADGCVPPAVVEIGTSGAYQYVFSPRSSQQEAADVEVLVSRPTALEQPGTTPTTHRATVSRPGAVASFRIPARVWNELELTVSAGTFRGPGGSVLPVDVTVQPPRGTFGPTVRLRHLGSPVSGVASISNPPDPGADDYLVVVDPQGDGVGTVDLTFQERHVG